MYVCIYIQIHYLYQLIIVHMHNTTSTYMYNVYSTSSYLQPWEIIRSFVPDVYILYVPAAIYGKSRYQRIVKVTITCIVTFCVCFSFYFKPAFTSSLFFLFY